MPFDPSAIAAAASGGEHLNRFQKYLNDGAFDTELQQLCMQEVQQNKREAMIQLKADDDTDYRKRAVLGSQNVPVKIRKYLVSYHNIINFTITDNSASIDLSKFKSLLDNKLALLGLQFVCEESKLDDKNSLTPHTASLWYTYKINLNKFYR